MRHHWIYLGGTFGLLFAGQGIAAAVSSPLPLLIGLVCGIACALVWIFHTTDPDPAHRRVAVSEEEVATATKRLKWVDQTIAELAVRAQIKPLRVTRFANAGVYYKPLWHRVNISQALCARLSNADLRLILAHEIGHATRRYATLIAFRESSRIAEEIRADDMALCLIGASKDDWHHAMFASLRAEDLNGSPREIAARLVALGLVVDGEKLAAKPC